MKLWTRLIYSIIGTALLSLAFVPSVSATDWDKKTFVTFSRPVELPGVALPAGTYIFEVPDVSGARQVVRVMNEKGDKVYATLLTIPTSRREPSDFTMITFMERAPRAPMPISRWFYPGERDGYQFVYPKAQADRIASASRQRSRTLLSRRTTSSGTRAAPARKS
jgi:hypothetical protein